MRKETDSVDLELERLADLLAYLTQTSHTDWCAEP